MSVSTHLPTHRASVSSIQNSKAGPLTLANSLHAHTNNNGSLSVPSVSAVHAASTLMEQERDMFRNHTFQQLKLIESQRRTEAEDKREELRQLVGIRYRVLIETADSILHMSDLASTSVTTIQHISNNTNTLQNRTGNKSSAGESKVSDDTHTTHNILDMLHTVATAAEQIWSDIKSHHWLSACQHYMTALPLLHTLQHSVQHYPHAHLQLHTAHHQLLDVDSLLLYVSQLRSTIAQVGDSLSTLARTQLSKANSSVAECSQALVCCWLTQSRPPIHTLLTLLLQARTRTISELLIGGARVLSAFPDARAGPTLTELLPALAYILRITILQLSSLFHIHSPTSVLLDTRSNMEFDVATLCQQYPSGSSTSTSSIQLLSHTQLMSAVNAWIQQCAHLIKDKLPSLLSQLHRHNRTVDGHPSGSAGIGVELARVRDAVLGELAGVKEQDGEVEKVLDSDGKHVESEIDIVSPVSPSLSSPSVAGTPLSPRISVSVSSQITVDTESRMRVRREQFESSSVSVCGRAVSVWDEVFASSFAAELKGCIERDFASIQLVAALQNMLTQWTHAHAPQHTVQNDHEDKEDSKHDTKEGDSDGSDSELNTSVMSSGSESDVSDTLSAIGVSGLGEKQIQSICALFNSQLTELIQDVQHILNSPFIPQTNAILTPAPSTNTSVAMPSPFPSLSRLLNYELRPHLHRMCSQMLARLVADLRQNLNTLQSSVLDAASSADAHLLVDQSVLIGRVCQLLAQQSKPLRSLLAMLSSDSVNSGSGAAVSSPSSLPLLLDTLSYTADFAFGIWTRFVGNALVDHMRAGLKTWGAAWALGDSLVASWKDRSSAGGSSLSVPSNPSHYIFAVLFRLTQDMYRVNGHHVQTTVLSMLIADVVHAVMECVEECICVDSTQTHSNTAIIDVYKLTDRARIQLLFDIKFLFAVLRLPDNRTSNKDSQNTGHTHNNQLQQYQTRLDSILTRIQNMIDPIDASVAKDVLTTALMSTLHRTATLFGSLTRHNPFPSIYYLKPHNTTSNTNTKDTHTHTTNTDASNLMPLATNTARLPMLPASLYPSRHKQTQQRTNNAHNSTTLHSSSDLPSTLLHTHLHPHAHSNTFISSHVSAVSNVPSGSTHLNNAAAAAVKSINDVKDKGRAILGKLNLFQ